jgi:type II secretory pathway component PulC
MRIPCLLAVWISLSVSGCATGAPSGRVTLVEPDPVPEFVIRRAALEEVLEKGPSWFIQQVGVQPVTYQGQFFGFMLVRLFEDDPRFEDVAIQPGDIVQRVNGVPIERPEQFMAVWGGLASSDRLSVQIVRGREPLVVTWLIH